MDVSRAAWIALGAMWLVGCRDATAIDISVTTDVACEGSGAGETLRATALYVGSWETFESTQVTETDACTPVAGELNRIGNLVVTPSGDDDSQVAVMVVAGVTTSVDACAANGFDGCIVARRMLNFQPNETLRLPIALRSTCLGVECVAPQTCVNGACVGAVVEPQEGPCDDGDEICAEPDPTTTSSTVASTSGGASGPVSSSASGPGGGVVTTDAASSSVSTTASSSSDSSSSSSTGAGAAGTGANGTGMDGSGMGGSGMGGSGNGGTGNGGTGMGGSGNEGLGNGGMGASMSFLQGPSNPRDRRMLLASLTRDLTCTVGPPTAAQNDAMATLLADADLPATGPVLCP